MRYIENPLHCPVTRTMSIIGGKWRPIILNCIGENSIRFGKLRQMMPAISNKVLSGELRCLEELGLIERKEFDRVSFRIEYKLTKQGQSLIPLLQELAKWGNTHFAKKLEYTLK